MINFTGNHFQDLIYKRGYLITDKEVDSPNPNWSKKKIGNYIVYYDVLNDVTYYKENEKWIFLLGSMIDVRNNTPDKELIIRNAIREWQISEEALFNYLDEISGRYIMMFHDGEKTRILSDATGMKTIIYSRKQTIIASHVQIVQQLTGADHSSLIEQRWIKEYGGYHIPGHYTPYEDIYFLTPNTLLEIESKEIERFYPRALLTIKNVDSITEEISLLVKRQLKILAEENNKMLFSLTAGIDSRTTLALIKEVSNKFLYFTYYKVSKKLPKGVESLEIDREVVGEMANNLNLNHRFIPLKEDEISSDYYEFVNAVKNNTFRAHSYRLAKFYYDELPQETLHIRSNILEIGRFFYRNKINLPTQVNIKSLAQCYNPKAANDKQIHSLLSTYYNHVQMDQIFNYDPYDIFYWEYRMGTWHAQILLESDVAHDTFIPFNCRRILELMLSVPNSDKKNFTVFKNIINKNWPILNYWGINTLEKPIDRLKNIDSQIDEYGAPLKNIYFNGSSNYKYKKLGKRAKFYLDISNPKKGEFAEATIPFSTPNATLYHCMLHLRSPYENRKNKGRLKYQVFINDTLLLEEDIALWKESNQINIHFNPSKEKSTIRIRVLAIKDCENWNWGKAAVIIVERFIVRISDSTKESINATSPFSTIS